MRFSAVPFAITLAGCSLFVGLDGLNGGTDSGGDAGSDAIASGDGAFSDGALRVDAGGDGATVIACPAGAIFCDDFETGDFSKWTNVANATAPSVFEVTPKQTWRGNGAMHALIADPADSGGAFAYYATESFPAIASGDFAIRAYVYTPAPTYYGSLFVLGHGQESGQTIVIGPNDDEHCPMGVDPCITASLVSGADWNASAGIPIPNSRWSCFELVVTVGDSGHVAAYLDGTSVLQMDENTIDPSGGYTSISVGFSGALAGEEVFMDDVAVAPKRVGCE